VGLKHLHERIFARSPWRRQATPSRSNGLPTISDIIRRADAGEALAALGTGHVRGKIVVTV